MTCIATFGCSYTEGITGSDYNWPAELAMLNNNFEIYNCAKSGTSVDYSLHVLENFLKIKTPDIVLFQVTTPHRFTYITNTESNIFEIKKYSENYYKFDIKDNKDLGFINAGSMSLKNNMRRGFTNAKTIQEFALLYYKLAGKNVIDKTKFNAYFSYIKKLLKDIPHLIIAHDLSEDEWISSNFIDFDIRKRLSDPVFESYIIDNGRHISRDGLVNVAKLLLQEIEERNMI